MTNVIGRDEASADFFDAAARGVLLTRYCEKCAAWSEPSASCCANCQSDLLVWRETSGVGHVASWVEIPPGRKEPEGTPSSIVALVQLDEGPWVTTAVAEGAIAETGTRVSIRFEHPEGGEPVPVAVPD